MVFQMDTVGIVSKLWFDWKVVGVDQIPQSYLRDLGSLIPQIRSLLWYLPIEICVVFYPLCPAIGYPVSQ